MLNRIVVSFLLAAPMILNASSVTLNSSANPSVFGHAVTLTAVVTPSTATGVVTFYDGTTVLETEPVVNGAAALTTTLLASGARSLKAYYGGDSHNAANSSAALAQTVNTVAANGFLTPVNNPVGPGPISEVMGDFNGDGKADLAVVICPPVGFDECATGTLIVLLGNGDGTFQPGVNYTVASTPWAFVVGDFNDDGKPDLAVENGSALPYSVSVFLGNGDGTFQAPINTSIDFGGEMAVGDFNGDGKADLAFGGELSVLLGNGDGTFQVAKTNSSNGYQSLVVGDFNGDGKADVAALAYDCVGCTSTLYLNIFLGNGDGTFQSPIGYETVTYPVSLAAGDVNGDGKTDLAVTAYDYTGTLEGYVSVFLGNGDGTFQTGGNLSVPGEAGPNGVAISDLNGDGKQDLVVANFDYWGMAEFLGNGDGTFQAPTYYATATFQGYSVIVGDFNGDGKADLAVNDDWGGDGYGIYMFLGAAFGPTTTTLTSSANPSTFGEKITLTVTVSPSTATGTVTFYYGSNAIGTGALTNGATTITTSTLSVGEHSLTATYSGDDYDAPSTSAPLIQTVGKAPTATVLASSPDPSTFQQAVTLTATVSPATATGTVVFYHGSTKLGTATLSGGVATLSISTLPEGSHVLTATYGGDGNDATSTSASVTQVVRQPTSTTLTSSPNPSNLNQSVTLTATVSPATASGTVTFLHGFVTIGTGVLKNGTATLTTTSLTAGSHALTASYSGNLSNGPSVSPTVVQVVN